MRSGISVVRSPPVIPRTLAWSTVCTGLDAPRTACTTGEAGAVLRTFAAERIVMLAE